MGLHSLACFSRSFLTKRTPSGRSRFGGGHSIEDAEYKTVKYPDRKLSTVETLAQKKINNGVCFRVTCLRIEAQQSGTCLLKFLQRLFF